MVRKLPYVTWPKGAIAETVKGWQQEWFYITEPLAPSQAEVPAFSAGPLRKFKSWKDKSVTWGNPK